MPVASVSVSSTKPTAIRRNRRRSSVSSGGRLASGLDSAAPDAGAPACLWMRCSRRSTSRHQQRVQQAMVNRL